MEKVKKSGTRNIVWNKGSKNWRVRLMRDGNVIELGSNADLKVAEYILWHYYINNPVSEPIMIGGRLRYDILNEEAAKNWESFKNGF